jgi:N-methylhydantoinase A
MLQIDEVNRLLENMREEALGVVRAGAGGRELSEIRTAYMRYVGQGHEVGVELPIRIETAILDEDAADKLLAAFESAYHHLYERTIPNLDVEILTWVLLVSTRTAALTGELTDTAGKPPPEPIGERELIDTISGQYSKVPVYARADLSAGVSLPGPAIILEKDTTTVVSSRFSASIHALGYIILEQNSPENSP